MAEEKKKNLHQNHRERVRERVEREGLDHFPDLNLLEYLLFYAIPRVDTNEIAHRLLDRFGSLAGVFDANLFDLCQVDGIGKHAALFLKSYAATSKRYFQSRFSPRKRDWSYDSIGKHFVLTFSDKEDEEVIGIFLDNAFSICGEKRLYSGSVNSVGFTQRKVAEACLETKASYMILAHNHPHGSAFPSWEDAKTTVTIPDFLANLGIVLLDHFIIGGASYSSLARTNFNYYERQRDLMIAREALCSKEVRNAFDRSDPGDPFRLQNDLSDSSLAPTEMPSFVDEVSEIMKKLNGDSFFTP